MDLPQRLAATRYLPTVDAGNPVARMLPLGYLKSQAWTRTPAQPRAVTTAAPATRTKNAGLEFLKQGLADGSLAERLMKAE
jgi:hypothetical protein